MGRYPKLKNCPFCASQTIHVLQTGDEPNKLNWMVKCNICMARVIGDTKSAVISNWNMRREHE